MQRMRVETRHERPLGLGPARSHFHPVTFNPSRDGIDQ